MANFRIVFINYYNGNLLADGFQINVFDRITNVLIDSAIIGQYPAHPNAGEATFTNLHGNSVYRIEFVGMGAPTGSHYMDVGIDSTIFTVPIYYQENVLSTFTNTTSAIILVAPGNYLSIPVYDVTGFSVNEYVLVAGDYGVFLAIITSLDYTNEIIYCVVTELLAGNPGDILQSDALVTLFAPDSFKGNPGIPGTNGSGSTITTNTLTMSTSAVVYEVDVFDGTAFPNNSNLLISDNVNTFTGYVSAGGTTNNLFVYATSIPASGYIFNSGSTVTFTGVQGIQGIQGIQGNQGIQGIQGNVGPQGPGSSHTISDILCPNVSNFQPLIVADNTAFPVGSYILVTAGLNTNFSGIVTSTVSTTGIIISVQQANGSGNDIPVGSVVTFSGPASNVPGPQGDQGLQGLQGEMGYPGHGSTIAIQPVPIQPIGTQIQIPVEDPIGFPPLSYAILTDGVYSIVGQITAMNIQTSTVGMRIIAIPNGNPGVSVLQGATLSYSGIPGPKNIFNIGQFGTVFYQDMGLNNVRFNSQTSINNVTPVGTLVFRLPNTLPVSYRVVVEFDGSVYTNGTLAHSNRVLLGISSNAAPTVASNTSSTLSGIGEPIQAKPTLYYNNVLADGLFIAGNVGNISQSTHLKYVGTFPPGIQLDFTLIGAAYEQFTTFYVQGILTATCYPLYQ